MFGSDQQVILEAIKQKIHLIISHYGLTHCPLLYWNDLVLDQIKLLANKYSIIYHAYRMGCGTGRSIRNCTRKLLDLILKGRIIGMKKENVQTVGDELEFLFRGNYFRRNG